MQAYGLSPGDVTTMKAEFNTKALEDLADKRTEAVMGSVQGSMMQEVATKVDTVILPFDASKIEIISKEMPPACSEVTPANIPKVPAGIPVIAIPNICGRTRTWIRILRIGWSRPWWKTTRR